MRENEELLEQAVFGEEVRLFLESRIGKYLLDKAESEYILSLQSLSTCDPSDTMKITSLQAEAKQALSFKNWLTDSVVSGLKALEIIEDRNS